ncbi:unnamed protein product, partial [Polarella glacialis]
VGRLNLSVTASHVFCEIWEASCNLEGSAGGTTERLPGPWRLCVIPRTSRPRVAQGMRSSESTDDLVEGLAECSPGAEEASTAEVAAGGDPRTGEKAKVVAFRGVKPWRSLLTQNHIWYLMSEGGSLNVLLLNQSPVRVITNLLIFENRTKASALCTLNGWNPKQLPVLTLFLGLRFRQLAEIRQSLGLLRPDQEMQGCQMVMNFIHSGYSCSGVAPPFEPSIRSVNADNLADKTSP